MLGCFGFRGCKIFPHVFHTSDGKEIAPEHAFYLQELIVRMPHMPHIHEEVFYKGKRWSEIFKYDDDHSENIVNVFVGYNVKSDTFVFIKHEKVSCGDEVCAICLEPLDSGTSLPYRFYGEHCYHDAHLDCANACKKAKTWFGKCCSHVSCNRASFTKPLGFIKAKVIGNRWKDVEDISVDTDYTSKVYIDIRNRYKGEGFVPFTINPYNWTVGSYHVIWKNRVINNNNNNINNLAKN